MTALTRDSISLRDAGVVYIDQPKTGFRFTLDSLLLADFCSIRPRDRILELGAGTGIVSILLAKKFPKTRLVAAEVEPEAYGLLCRNIETNGLADRVVPVDEDIKHLGRGIAPNAFDVIVANPPYTKHGTGRSSPSRKRQTARHDQAGPLAIWLDRRDLLKNRGKFILVFPAIRAAELISLLRQRSLEPKRMRFVHPSALKPASVVLIEAMKGAGIGLEVLPPLIVHEQAGNYSEEMQKVYGME